ncbi:MAG: hypothetical protein ACE148_16250 [Vicinamibacterales bacterium]
MREPYQQAVKKVAGAKDNSQHHRQIAIEPAQQHACAKRDEQ